MTARDEKYRQKYMKALAPKVDGELLAVGLFSQPDAMGAALASQASALAGTLLRRSGKAKAGGLPMNVVLVATEAAVYAFEYKPKGTGLKVKDPVAVWDRSHVRVAGVTEGAMADRIYVQIGEQRIELDSNKMPGFKSEFNEPLLQLLAT